MTVFEKIEAQQKKEPYGSVAWCVAEDLKAICEDPDCAVIVAEDLESESMSIQACAKKNQENADRIYEQNKGRCVRIPDAEERRIIREFYGLPTETASAYKAIPEEQKTGAAPDLFGFF